MFQEAEFDCQMRGGHLLSVGSAEEYEAITTELEVAFQNAQEEWWFIGEDVFFVIKTVTDFVSFHRIF